MIPFPSIAGIQAALIKWLAIAAVGAGLFLAGYLHGQHVAEGDVARAQLEIAIAYAGEILARQGIADNLADENAKLRADQAPKDRIITKEITRYVEVTPPDQRCTLPGTWRLRHDAAATGQPADPQAGPLATGAADPVDDAAALETLGTNYQACRNDQAKLAGWQRRYRALEAAP